MEKRISAHVATAAPWILLVSDGLLFGRLRPEYAGFADAVVNGLAVSGGFLLLTFVVTRLWGLGQRFITGRRPERFGNFVWAAAILSTFAALNEILYKLLGLGHH